MLVEAVLFTLAAFVLFRDLRRKNAKLNPSSDLITIRQVSCWYPPWGRYVPCRAFEILFRNHPPFICFVLRDMSLFVTIFRVLTALCFLAEHVHTLQHCAKF